LPSEKLEVRRRQAFHCRPVRPWVGSLPSPTPVPWPSAAATFDWKILQSSSSANSAVPRVETALSKSEKPRYTPPRFSNNRIRFVVICDSQELSLTPVAPLVIRLPLKLKIEPNESSATRTRTFARSGATSSTQIAELCCVLDFAGNQHCPPSWVEALNSLDQVVIGSATPVGASQWGFFGSGAEPLCSAPADFPVLEIRLPYKIAPTTHSILRRRQEGRGGYQGATSHAADRSSFKMKDRSALRVVAPWSLFSIFSSHAGALLHDH